MMYNMAVSAEAQFLEDPHSMIYRKGTLRTVSSRQV